VHQFVVHRPLIEAGIYASIGTVGTFDHPVVVLLAGIGLLTFAKVLVAKVAGQGAYMPRRNDEQTGVSQGSCIPRVAVSAAGRCYPVGCRDGRGQAC
jgi:hypothetical protein